MEKDFGPPQGKNQTAVFVLSIKSNIKLHWVKTLLMITSLALTIIPRSYKFRFIYQIYISDLYGSAVLI